MNLLIRLIMLREYPAAQRLIYDALANRVGNASLLHYYAALLRMEQRDPAGAEKELAQCDPGAMEDLTIKYHFLRGEAARLQGRNAEAREHFRRSLASPDPFGFRAEVERALALPGIAGSGADQNRANTVRPEINADQKFAHSSPVFVDQRLPVHRIRYGIITLPKMQPAKPDFIDHPCVHAPPRRAHRSCRSTTVLIGPTSTRSPAGNSRPVTICRRRGPFSGSSR